MERTPGNTFWNRLIICRSLLSDPMCVVWQLSWSIECVSVVIFCSLSLSFCVCTSRPLAPSPEHRCLHLRLSHFCFILITIGSEDSLLLPPYVPGPCYLGQAANSLEIRISDCRHLKYLSLATRALLPIARRISGLLFVAAPGT